MMKYILSFISFLFFTGATAQTQNLITLAEGDFLGLNALFDEKGHLFGYISIYDYGKSGAKTKKFEYVLLDKNLNPFANKAFEGDITAGSYYGYINFDGKVVLSPNALDYSLVEKKDMFTPSAMLINLKDNSISKKVYYDYDHGKFSEILQYDTWAAYRKEYKAEKKQKGFNYVSQVGEIKEGGYLVFVYDEYRNYTKNNALIRYDEEKKEMWKFEYNKDGSKTKKEILNILDKDEHHYYALLRKHTKLSSKDINYTYGVQGNNTTSDTSYLLVIDMKTGKEIHRKYIPDPEDVLTTITRFPTLSYGLLDNDKTFDDKIVIVGRVGYYMNYTGICRLVVDKKTFNTDLKVLSYKDDFKEFVPKIKPNGFVENSFELDPRDIFILKDGRIGILYEKYKVATQHTAQKTTDMIYVYTDKDFKITGAKLFEKEKSRWQNADYLFSQNLNNDDDLVFFYRDYQKDDETKDRNWNLFINTFINEKFNQEMIPISSKEDFLIIPYVAKEGYILLQEFNKKAKYNQIRLERLNY